ncbi:MAG: serine hydrolase [Actinomycetota bacterium]|nr:serine hydrolase [Actinomycetota bacterium]
MAPASKAATARPPEDLPASSWILIDPASGDVLAAEDPRSAFPVASATKLMTYYVSARRLRPEREVIAAPYDPTPGESLAGFVAGDTLTARDVFYGLLVASGNDAAAALALAVAGSQSDFVSRMNAAADELGLDETEYVDPIGIGSGNVSSARDLADLATKLQGDELFREIVDTPRATLRSGTEPIRAENSNALVLDEPFVDGIKTGTTVEAGFVLVASGEKRGVRLISAVLGAPDESSRDSATLELLGYGFSLYERRTLVRAGDRVGSAPVADGSGRLFLEAATDLEEVARMDQRVKVALGALEPVSAPVEKGDPLGVATVRLDGMKVGEVDVVAAQAVAGPLDQGPADTGTVPAWVWIALTGALVASALLAAAAIGPHRRGER